MTPYEGGVGPDHPEGGPEDHARTTPGPDHLGVGISTPSPNDWQERLHAAVAETIRRRQARRDLRRQLDQARTIGLARRHHTKLHGRKDQP